MEHSPQATMVQVTGALLKEARQVVECVGASSDAFAISERGVAYGLLLEARQWLMSPPVEQATLYDGQPPTTMGPPAINAQVERFSQLPSREQFQALIELGGLLQSAHEDLRVGQSLDHLDRPVATAFFLSPRISSLLNAFLFPFLFCLVLLGGRSEARANEDPAIFSQQVIERWVSDTVQRLPAGTRISVAPMTWPTQSKLITRHVLGKGYGALEVRRALMAQLTAKGFTVVENDWTGWDVSLMGGVSDHGPAAVAWLFSVSPHGKIQPLSRVKLAIPVWPTTAPYDAWTSELQAFSETAAATLWMTGHRRVAIGLSPVDPYGQTIPGASRAVHRVWWPLMVEALQPHGIEVYLPNTPGGPLAELEVAIEWPQVSVHVPVTDQHGYTRRALAGATVHTWVIERRGARVMTAGPLTLPLRWPRGVPGVSSVEKLPRAPLAIPAKWSDNIRPLPPLSFERLPDQRAHTEQEHRADQDHRASWWAAQRAYHDRSSREMLEDATQRIVKNWRRSVHTMDQAWATNPSREVPAQLRLNAERLHRHNRAIEDTVRRRIESVPIDRGQPYPRG